MALCSDTISTLHVHVHVYLHYEENVLFNIVLFLDNVLSNFQPQSFLKILVLQWNVSNATSQLNINLSKIIQKSQHGV